MSEETKIKCLLLERMAAEFEACTSKLPMSRFEADEEALNLMKLATRHVTAVVAIARAGFHLLSPAEVAARAAYEASVRAAWMLNPEDPFDREARWAAHLHGEVAYLDKEIDEGKNAMGIDTKDAEERRDTIDGFCGAVSKLLVDRGYPPKRGLPPIPEMLKEIGERRTYAIYSYSVRPLTVVTTALGYLGAGVLELIKYAVSLSLRTSGAHLSPSRDLSSKVQE